LETKVASIQERENVLKFEGNFNILRWIYWVDSFWLIVFDKKNEWNFYFQLNNPN
jgi:hypothetical protein